MGENIIVFRNILRKKIKSKAAEKEEDGGGVQMLIALYMGEKRGMGKTILFFRNIYPWIEV